MKLIKWITVAGIAAALIFSLAFVPTVLLAAGPGSGNGPGDGSARSVSGLANGSGARDGSARSVSGLGSARSARSGSQDGCFEAAAGGQVVKRMGLR